MIFLFVFGVAFLAIVRTLCSMWGNYGLVGIGDVRHLLGVQAVSSAIGGCVAWVLGLASLAVGSSDLGRVGLLLASVVFGMVVVPSVGESIGVRHEFGHESLRVGMVTTGLVLCLLLMLGAIVLGIYVCSRWSGLV